MPTVRLSHLDWVRGLAVLTMVLGHVSDSWTLESDRHGPPFWTISFIAGLGAPLFLFVAGVSMALAAETHSRKAGVAAAGRRLWRRGWQIFALAFLFRVQALVLGQGAPITLLTVDILNVMGLSMVAGAWLWQATASATRRAWLLAVVALMVAVVTPFVWTAPALAWIPDPLRWYLQPTPGRTNFTLLPFAGFLFAGLLSGGLLTRAHAGAAPRATYAWLACAGAGLAGIGWWASHGPLVFPRATFWGSSPTFFALRLGILILLLPAAWAHYAFWRSPSAPSLLAPVSRPIDDIVETLGRSSLFVYWIHVEMVYGPAADAIKRQLPLPVMLGAAAALSLLLYGIVLVKNRWAQGAVNAHGAVNGGRL